MIVIKPYTTNIKWKSVQTSTSMLCLFPKSWRDFRPNIDPNMCFSTLARDCNEFNLYIVCPWNSCHMVSSVAELLHFSGIVGSNIYVQFAAPKRGLEIHNKICWWSVNWARNHHRTLAFFPWRIVAFKVCEPSFVHYL